MPKPGYKALTIPEWVYKKLEKLAKDEDKSVAGKCKEIILQTVEQEATPDA